MITQRQVLVTVECLMACLELLVHGFGDLTGLACAAVFRSSAIFPVILDDFQILMYCTAA